MVLAGSGARKVERWSTAARVCVSAHTLSKSAASSQTPSHPVHSSSDAPPSATCCSSFLQDGHLAPEASASTRSRRAPHFGQKAAPSNMSAKHDGQLTIAKRAWQYGQRRASGSAAAPQLGQ